MSLVFLVQIPVRQGPPASGEVGTSFACLPVQNVTHSVLFSWKAGKVARDCVPTCVQNLRISIDCILVDAWYRFAVPPYPRAQSPAFALRGSTPRVGQSWEVASEILPVSQQGRVGVWKYLRTKIEQSNGMSLFSTSS